jgi:hypothetical protein
MEKFKDENVDMEDSLKEKVDLALKVFQRDKFEDLERERPGSELQEIFNYSFLYSLCIS